MSTGLSFPPIYLPWSPASMTPEQVQHITSLIFMENMRTVVEIGAGVSTPCIAWAMMHGVYPGGNELHVIETDDGWVDKVQLLIKRVRTIVEPGRRFSVHYHQGTMEAIAENAGRPVTPDMIIIDGPDASDDPDIRLCNIDYVDKVVNSGMRVFVDDLNRPGEQRLFDHLTALNAGLCEIETRKENYGIIRYH